MKFMLITVRNIISVEIITEIFETKEAAYDAMKTQLRERLKRDGYENYIDLISDGIEFSNAILNENDGYYYEDCGKVWHHWKIVEV